jgi:hypothetical protein
MLQSEKFINNHAAQAATAQIAAAATAVEEKKGGQEIQIDALLLAYQSIYEAVQLTHQAAQTEAKGMTTNASAQNRLIDWETGLHFQNLSHDQLFAVETIRDKHQIHEINPDGSGGPWHIFYTTRHVEVPKEVAQKDLEDLDITNQQISAVRNVLEDNLTLLRQGAQVSETQLNSTIDENQQDNQQGSSLLQMLIQLTERISRV